MRLGLLTMKAAVNFGVWGSGPAPNIAFAQRAESLGYHSIWTSEASGTDAVVPLAWLAAHTKDIKLGTAIMQMSARAPTTTAMTAATLDHLSGGRFILGLGVSGPAVVEGWHGQRYGEPLAKTREYLAVIRAALARTPVDHMGEYYDIPYRSEDATGLASPVRTMFRPRRSSIPVYLAAMGPRNVALAHEIADGVMPAFYSPYKEDVFFASVGSAATRRRIEIAPFVPVALGDDVDACRERLKPTLAFWIGGMGAKGVNFYNRFTRRLGYEQEAREVQQLYTSGRHRQAAAAVPDALVDEISLCGPRARVADQLRAWEDSSVTQMLLGGIDGDTMNTLAELAL